jgi:hypothetical protein
MMRLVGVVLLWMVLLVVACTGQNGTSAGIPDTGVLFADQFVPGETGRWLIEGDRVSAAALRNEQLTIAVNEAQTVHYATLDNEIFTDFVLDVETTLLSGNPENSFGVLFRMADGQQFYRFALTGSGLYMVERRDGDSVASLTQGWLDSVDLVQGVGAVNRLQIRVEGDQFAFTINGAPTTELTDGSFTRGNIALDAGTFARPGIEVAFDNLVITRP